MISITINAETAAQAREEMRALLVVADGGAVDAAPEKPKATRSTKAKTEPAKQDIAEAGDNADASDEKSDASTSTTATSDASPSDAPLEAVPDEASLRKRATQYAAKAGPTALVEMQKAAGAPNGKMSEIVTDPESMKKLDILLADAGY